MVVWQLMSGSVDGDGSSDLPAHVYTINRGLDKAGAS
jgi:hypothetical protein